MCYRVIRRDHHPRPRGPSYPDYRVASRKQTLERLDKSGTRLNQNHDDSDFDHMSPQKT